MADYHEYINSPEWRIKAEAAKERAAWRCQVCNDDPPRNHLHAHHRTYERLGRELPEDITVLCDYCHRLYHSASGQLTSRTTAEQAFVQDLPRILKAHGIPSGLGSETERAGEFWDCYCQAKRIVCQQERLFGMPWPPEPWQDTKPATAFYDACIRQIVTYLELRA